MMIGVFAGYYMSMEKKSFRTEYFKKIFSKEREPGILRETKRISKDLSKSASEIRALDFFIIYFRMSSEPESCYYYDHVIYKLIDLNPDLFILVSTMEEDALHRAFNIRVCPTLLIGGNLIDTNTKSHGAKHTKPIPISELKDHIYKRHGVKINTGETCLIKNIHQ